MKTSKKVLAIVLAVALLLALSITAFAKTVNVGNGPASITIQLPTWEEGYTAENTYKFYKVFDASISTDATGATTGTNYSLTGNHTTVPDGFVLDAAGNVKYAGTSTDDMLTDTDIAAIKAYVTDNDLVTTVTTTASDTSITVTGLEYGYYYIDTTTGTVITVDSANPDATVNDKNEVPPVDKKITGASYVDTDGKKAMAEVGTTVTYEASITVEKGAENYVFHDKMSDGLTYKGDIVVTVGTEQVDPVPSKFTVGALGDDTITVTFDNTYIAGLADGTKITFTYSATVNSDALQLDPANNTAYLSYGDKNADNRTPVVNTEVYNAKISVKKTDENDKPLAGAEFVLKNKGGEYYSINAAGQIEWVDTVDAADKHVSDAQGDVAAFAGLANGEYTLVEVKAPDGYNVAADETFTIAEGDYTAPNLIQSTTVINKEGPTLPSTGGIGTTIFYIVGSVLLLAAAIVLIARRRTAADAA